MKISLSMAAAGAVLFLVLLGTGCTTAAQVVPKTVIKWNATTGDVAIEAPKDVEMTGLKIARVSTNGATSVRVSLDAYKARMNPDVIAQSALGTAEMVKAVSAATADVFERALSAYLKANGAGLLAAPVPTPGP